MKLRSASSCSFPGIALAATRRADGSRAPTRQGAVAVWIALAAGSPVAMAAGGLPHDARLPVVAGTGTLASPGSATHDIDRPGHGVLGNGGERLALNGVEWQPFDPSTADRAVPHDATATTHPAAGAGAERTSVLPEPTDLALLGDGLLVLIAWAAARQTRRSRTHRA